MRRLTFITMLFVITIAPHARADSGCSVLLASPPSSNRLASDQALQAYFSDLLQETVLGTEELIAYKKNLEKGKIVNPVTDQVALMKDGAWVHQDSLQRRIDGGGLSVEAQLEWAIGKLKEREYNEDRQRITRAETRGILLPDVYPFVKVIPMEGGSFTMGSPKSEVNRAGDESQVEVELSPFEIMDAPVTQELWVAVMEENPSLFQEREHCKNHKLIGDIQLCPELPVESVSWDDIQIFLQRLNEMLVLTGDTEGAGMRPSDVSPMGSAGAGCGGKCYRLPTEAEWEYAARAGTTTAYFFGDSPKDLKKYAVYDRNSGGQTRPVRSKLPNQWGLYDVHGNVLEWTQDWYGEKLIGGKDPRQSSSGTFRIHRGGSWLLNAGYARSAVRSYDNPLSRNYGHHGFRLARSLPLLRQATGGL